MATRMTNTARARIVDAVMADIPQTDFAALAREEAVAAAIAAMPSNVRQIATDPELADYLNIEYIFSDCGGIRAAVPARRGECRLSAIAGDDAWNAYRARCGERTKQQDERRQLRDQLNASLAGCRTVEQFIERFPGIAHYAPQVESATANLPATTALMDSLAAAGLPQKEAVDA